MASALEKSTFNVVSRQRFCGQIHCICGHTLFKVNRRRAKFGMTFFAGIEQVFIKYREVSTSERDDILPEYVIKGKCMACPRRHELRFPDLQKAAGYKGYCMPIGDMKDLQDLVEREIDAYLDRRRSRRPTSEKQHYEQRWEIRDAQIFCLRCNRQFGSIKDGSEQPLSVDASERELPFRGAMGSDISGEVRFYPSFQIYFVDWLSQVSQYEWFIQLNFHGQVRSQEIQQVRGRCKCDIRHDIPYSALEYSLANRIVHEYSHLLS